jgi:hypothetical protein
MNPNLFIRFKGIDANHDSDVDLAELGESLVGFDSVFKELAAVMRVEEELEIKATAIEEGSIVFDLIVWVQHGATSVPFHSIDDLLNFLKLAGDPLWHEAVKFFNSIEEAHKTLNDWVSKYPLDFAAFGYLLGKAIEKLLKKARKNKDKPDYADPDLPKRIAEELHKLIKRHGFKKALKPIVEDKAQSIEVSTNRTFSSSAKIDQDNFQDYLAEDEQILPHLENGKNHTLVGKVTSLKGTRGDSLNFQMQYSGDTFNLDTLPAEGETSKTYRQFYKEGTVQIEATVIRDSLYKKPKLRLHKIDLVQSELKLEKTDKAQERQYPKNRRGFSGNQAEIRGNGLFSAIPRLRARCGGYSCRFPQCLRRFPDCQWRFPGCRRRFLECKSRFPVCRRRLHGCKWRLLRCRRQFLGCQRGFPGCGYGLIECKSRFIGGAPTFGKDCVARNYCGNVAPVTVPQQHNRPAQNSG